MAHLAVAAKQRAASSEQYQCWHFEMAMYVGPPKEDG
jgi:hypothetical protein